MLHTLPHMRLGLGRADYSLAVKRNANGSWRWEVNCAGRSTSVEKSSVSIRRRPQAEQSPPEQSRVFLVELDKLDEVFNSEVGKRYYAVFSDAIDPDDAVLGIHFVGDVAQPVFVFAEVLSNTGNGGDVMNLV